MPDSHLHPTNAPEAVPAGWFQTTHWSVVLSAGQGKDAEISAALEKLCHAYWYPIYAYVRRRGYAVPDAEDLTQSFFARMLEKRYLGLADPAKGKFRTFLLCSLQRFLADEWDRGRARKRGGGLPPFSLDEQTAEGRYLLEPADPVTAEALYHRRWAYSVLDDVLARLERELTAEGKADQFAHLKVYLIGDRGEVPFVDTAAALRLSESAVKTVVHRLRRRYRDLVREVVAETVQDPREVDEEIRQLMSALTP